MPRVEKRHRDECDCSTDESKHCHDDKYDESKRHCSDESKKHHEDEESKTHRANDDEPSMEEVKWYKDIFKARRWKMVNGKLTPGLWFNACALCHKNKNKVTISKFPDEKGNPRRLCGPHAHELKSHVPQHPCEGCVKDGVKTPLESNHPNAKGEKQKLCAGHADKYGTWHVRNPCEVCVARGEPPEFAHYPNQQNQLKFCARHAHEFETWVLQIHNKCVECIKEGKSNPPQANWNNEDGKSSQYCAGHARNRGLQYKRECEDCITGNITPPGTASHKNKQGKTHMLCTMHAELAGTYEMHSPCDECVKLEITPVKRGQYYRDDNGIFHKLCAPHACSRGFLAKTYPGASRIACQAFDYIKKVLGIDIQHIHFVLDKEIPEGKEEVIQGTRLKPDGRLNGNNKVLYEFLGNLWHGYPVEHPKYQSAERRYGTRKTSKELYESTMERFLLISNLGYTIHFIWEHEWKQAKRVSNPRPIKEIIHTFNPKEWTEFKFE